jgi:hypothetical protein
MKIYQVCHQDCDYGHIVEWYSSKANAQKACARIRKEYKAKAKEDYEKAMEKYGECIPWQKLYADPDPMIFDFDVTPTKAGFLKFLNVHFTTNNG